MTHVDGPRRPPGPGPPFGWAITVGGMAQTVYHGIERVRSRFILTMAADNLAQLSRLLAA